jgi:hypothetical protein
MAGEELARDSNAAKRAIELDQRSLHEATEQQVGSEIEDLYKRLSRRWVGGSSARSLFDSS